MIRRCVLFTAAAFVVASSCYSASGQQVQRRRQLLDQDWRFTKGDPAGIDPTALLYDARPVARGEDQLVRAAESTEEAAKLQATTHPVLKPWILPTGNSFIKDPAKRFQRPPEDPGFDIPYVRASFDDSGWSKINLPHDWAISGPFNSGDVGGGMGRLPSPGIGWYRKKLNIPLSDAGKSVFLEVDGAMSYAAVWLNGKLVGGWPYGYASWQLDLTPYIIPGKENELAIRLDNPPDFSRWYPGAGIYRHVWLLTANSVHVGHWGTYVTTTNVSRQSADIKLKVTVDNDSKTASTLDVVTDIYPLSVDGLQAKRAVASMPRSHLVVAGGAHADAESTVQLKDPMLWGPPPQQKPNRYVAITQVLRDGKVSDRYETPFGIRTIAYHPDGLYVNGQRIRLQGVNQHHDLGALGSAFNQRAAERQLQELREMGCNAIRMAHNPPAPELLELTDRMGFLVIDEVFDAWLKQKTPFDFHLIFTDWHEQDLRSMIRRDRDHPSIYLWSVGNEVGEQNSGEAGAAVARELVAIAHDEDATRAVTASMNSAPPNSPFAAAVDVLSLNYQGEGIRNTPEFANFNGLKKPAQYDAFREKFPQRMIESSESAAAFSSRDSYLFPVAAGISNPARDGSGEDSATRQVSAYELYAADFGSTADKVFEAQDRHPFVAGEFVWSGWDYLGEPSPYYSSRSSYYGIIDLAGLKKDRFYLYQSRWRPDLPMAHILPHWTWPDRVDKVTPVHVFTSGDEAELFLDGRSLGRKKKGPYEYRLRWDDVRYEPGTLKVVAYKKGAVWATDEVHTAGQPVALKLEPDRTEIDADGNDLSFLTVTVVDRYGVWNPQSANRIHFAVSGPGEIVAADDGDPTDMEVFPSHDRRAFHGKCVVIVRSQIGTQGMIHVTASADGLQDGNAQVFASRLSPKSALPLQQSSRMIR